MADAAFAGYLLPAERRVLRNARDGRPLLAGYDEGAAFKQETTDAYKAAVAARDLLLRVGMVTQGGQLTDKGRVGLERVRG